MTSGVEQIRQAECSAPVKLTQIYHSKFGAGSKSKARSVEYNAMRRRGILFGERKEDVRFRLRHSHHSRDGRDKLFSALNRVAPLQRRERS
jgi:hypothetical protein